MSYGLQLISDEGILSISQDHPTYQVNQVLTVHNASSFTDTGIVLPAESFLMLGYAGYEARCHMGIDPVTHKLHLVSTNWVKIIVLSKYPVGSPLSGYGLAIYSENGELLYSSVLGTVVIDTIVEQATYGNLGVTEHPEVHNSYSVSHEGGKRFISEGIPFLVAGRYESGNDTNTTGLSYFVDHTSIGFSKSWPGTASGDIDAGGAGRVFSVATGKYYV